MKDVKCKVDGTCEAGLKLFATGTQSLQIGFRLEIFDKIQIIYEGLSVPFTTKNYGAK